MKRFLLLLNLSLFALGLMAQNNEVSGPNFGLLNLTNGFYRPNSEIHTSTSNYMGSACQGETHQLKLVPNSSSFNDSPQHTITPLDSSFDVTIVNTTYPNPASVTFNQSGIFYFSFSEHVGVMFHMLVYPSEITITPSNASIYLGQDIELSSNSQPNQWSMGDGTTYTSNPVIHTYESTGEYTVNLNAGSENCEGQAEAIVTVLPNNPTIASSNLNPCVNENITLSASCPYEEGVGLWQWLVNGQIIGSGQQINWTPTSEGSYTITLNTYDINNNPIGSAQLQIQTPPSFSNQNILGSSFYCGTQIYTIENYNPNFEYDWSVTGGTLTADNGNTITVEWLNNISGGHIVLNIYDPITGCKSTSRIEVNKKCCEINGLTPDYVINDGWTQDPLIELNGGSTVSNKTLFVNGDFHVNNEQITFNGCRVFVAPYAKIFIEEDEQNNYGTLISNNSIFTACFDTVWYGFDVDRGHLKITNSTVSHADHGIILRGDGFGQSHNGQSFLELKHSQFLNNNTHLFAQYNIDTNSTIYGNTFNVTSPHLMYPYHYNTTSSTGILLVYVPHINIGENIADNVFKKMSFGIYSSYSNATIRHNQFIDLPGLSFWPEPINGVHVGTAIYAHTPHYEDHTLTIHNNTFRGNIAAVDADKMNIIAHNNHFEEGFIGVRTNFLNNQRVDVNNNTFEGISQGVVSFVTGGGNINYSKNKFEVGSVAITSSSEPGTANANHTTSITENCIADYTVGIYVNGEYQTQINRNWLWNTFATGISLVSAFDTDVTSNNIQGQGHNLMASTGLHATLSGLSNIRRNTVDHFQRSMQFTSANHGTRLRSNLFRDGKYGVYLANQGVIGPQGSPNEASDNRWVGTGSQAWGTNRPHLFSHDSYGELSPFYHRMNSQSFSMGGFNPFMSDIMGGTYIPAIPVHYSPGYPILAEQVQCFELLNRGIINSFDDYIHFVFSEWTDDFNPYWFNFHQMVLRWIGKEHHLLENRPDLQAFLQEAQQRPIYKIQQSLKYASEGRYDKARETINKLEGRNDITRTAKEVYDIYFGQLGQDRPMRTLSLAKQDRLKELAKLCPFTHGTAVYVARSMARFYDREWVNYRNDCEIGTPWIGARKSTFAQDLKVYPNPFAEALHIETNGSRIGIYDVMGKLHHEQEVLSGNKNSILLGDLPIGIYILKAFNDDGQELSSEKVIKIRK
ncbi:MAG: right-handed parallel beta-helix repeat-containing protein [Flavobacteriales bacterium]|nr:right-handed parallel beta-helix repeat-containing protein [Flavobacteriales bacterium]